MRRVLLLLLCVLAGPAAAQPAPHSLLADIAASVSQDQVKATVTRLVGFGTRHAMSDTGSKTRGIGAARAWVKNRFMAISRDCGGCLAIETPSETVTGARIPKPTAIVDVLAIQRGTTDPDRVIVISGHVDSILIQHILDADSDAPGADDDASGTAAVIEAARVLSRHKFPATLVFAVLSGEEQGLYGGTVLAHYAKAQGWQVEADLNNDIVGNSRGDNGTVDASHVRIYSEGTRSLETPAEADKRRYNGGELDSPSRNLARFVAGLGETYLSDFHPRMVYRTDRYGRGGDQVPMLGAGFPAIRLTEAAENYTHEHQTPRMENGIAYGDMLDAVDFTYLAQVTRLNAVAMAVLAMAAAPLRDVTIAGAVSWDTTLKWAPSPGAASYRCGGAIPWRPFGSIAAMPARQRRSS